MTIDDFDLGLPQSFAHKVHSRALGPPNHSWLFPLIHELEVDAKGRSEGADIRDGIDLVQHCHSSLCSEAIWQKRVE